MATRAKYLALACIALCAVFVVAAPSAGAVPTWRLEELPKPAAAPFSQPLGVPADLNCWSATRCLLFTQGGTYYKNGFFLYDGVAWRRQGTVCGMGTDENSAETTRVIWAGPTEFWTVNEPSLPRTGLGQALCHVVNGEVVGSYSTPQNSPDRFATMTAGACTRPDSCWFGGVGAESPDGSRIGGFRIYWDGVSLRTIYAPQGRGVSDIVASNGLFFESTFVGPAARVQREPDLAQAEDEPRLIKRVIEPAVAGEDPQIDAEAFTPTPPTGMPVDSAELLALDATGGFVWAAGGGATSGPAATTIPAARGPLLARRGTDGGWDEIDLTSDGFAATDVFRDVAALPGGDAAWVVIQDRSNQATNSGVTRVARISVDGTVTPFALTTAGGLPAGTAQRIECPTAEECWVVTHRGLVFHLTDGTPRSADTDPAFSQVIAYRPNESLEQGLGDGSVVDDSMLFAPPEAVDQGQPQATPTKRLKPAVKKLRSKLRGSRLTISFVVVRDAKIGFSLRRNGRVVARVKPRMLRAGTRRRSLSVRLNAKRWPDSVRFSIREPGQYEADDDKTVSVPDSGVIG